MRKYFMIFIVLNGLDYLTTRVCIAYGAIEGNPIANYFLQMDMLGLYKVVLVFIFGLIILYIHNKRSERRARNYMHLANAVLFLVVLWNMYVMFLQMGYL